MNVNYLSKDPEFRKTKLYRLFSQKPLGFVDIGSLGEVHDLVHPIAPLAHALCFELNREGCKELRDKYKSDKSFAKVSVLQAALFSKVSRQKLYIARALTNTSLLEPNPAFIKRYQAEKFAVEQISSILTQTLDSIIFSEKRVVDRHMGELIKLDTQGSEYDILKGAKQVLSERCLGVWCEVEFFEVYRNQRTFSDIDRLLRKYGLFFYGIYPHYRSTKFLNRKEFSSEERIMWADVLFLKDPLDERNRKRCFSERDIAALILIAISSRFYNFALELIQAYYEEDEKQRKVLEDFVRRIAIVDQKVLIHEVENLSKACRKQPDLVNLLVGKFVDLHRSNSNSDYLTM